jgi:hypothetical protein
MPKGSGPRHHHLPGTWSIVVCLMTEEAAWFHAERRTTRMA